jgi:hypothetical protein
MQPGPVAPIAERAADAKLNNHRPKIEIHISTQALPQSFWGKTIEYPRLSAAAGDRSML